MFLDCLMWRGKEWGIQHFRGFQNWLHACFNIVVLVFNIQIGFNLEFPIYLTTFINFKDRN